MIIIITTLLNLFIIVAYDALSGLLCMVNLNFGLLVFVRAGAPTESGFLIPLTHWGPGSPPGKRTR